jgi:subtilisin family serine protease
MAFRSTPRVRIPLLAAAAAVGLVASIVTLDPAGAAPAAPGHRVAGNRLDRPNIPGNTINHGLPRAAQALAAGRPDGAPVRGQYAFLLRLGTDSTLATYRQFASRGRATARTESISQFNRIKQAQAAVISALPRGARVLYKSHAVLPGVAVRTDVRNYGALQRIRGVAAVYPIAPKTVSNSYAVPLYGTPTAWESHGGNLGANSTIAIIDTGIDYTHADLGGSGNPADYTTALANDTADPTYPDPSKIVGGHDFAGDAYDASTPANATPVPDNNPLDCNGHGSHVAGTAAGYGETSGGTTYAGPWDTTTPFNTMRIGPGMAPMAHLLAYKVFGCGGSTDLVGAALDAAADPNGDGDPTDHADVVNMSLGSDYGSPLDGDSVASNFASQLGITVVAASGNGGDYYDVGGSPGNAVRTIAVANSVDAYNQIDTLHATVNGDSQQFGAQRSVDFTNWATGDFSGETVTRLSDPADAGNQDGCDSTIHTNVTGKVVFLEWTDNDALRRCGSATRADNIEAAGGVGVILGEDSETFAAGIAGNATIPVVQVVKSAADDIRAALDASQTVTADSTTTGDFSQLVPGDDDKVNTSSSRGIRGAGNVKPDVTAVGTSVFSTAMGTGDQGVSFTGTSMATPMVAGLAALVHTAHPAWNAEEVKADIMNTAGQDLFTGGGHTGTKYAPNRVGAGRIEADKALGNLVLAYVQDNPGAVSVSFGPVAITAATTLTKTVKVVNKSLNSATYSLKYRAITSVPGVSYQVSPTTLTLGPAATKTFTVRLVVTNPALLTKTLDATMARNVDLGGLTFPREFVADASGLVVLTAGAGNSPGEKTPLRVPVYSAPRPASSMSEPGTLNLPGSGVQTGSLSLSGQGVNQGSGNARVKSYVTGLERQATSGLARTCATPSAVRCVHNADERSADLKYVGFTSDAEQLRLLGADPLKDISAQSYISITTQRPWRSPVGAQEFDVLIDTNLDNVPDAIMYNTRAGAEDIYLSELVDTTNPNPAHWFIRDDEFINDRLGSLDTALFDSDTMLLPLWPDALGTGGGDPALPGFSRSHSRFHYGVVAYGPVGVVDSIGVNLNTFELNSGRLSADVLHPGVEMWNSANLSPLTTGLVLNPDSNGARLTVRRNVAAYNTDKGNGALVVHFHNKVGAKTKLLTLKTKPKVTLTLSKTTLARNHRITATITVANTAGRVPTGTVKLRRASGVVIKSGTLANGKVSLSFTPTRAGTFRVYATYGGSTYYASGASATVTYRVS